MLTNEQRIARMSGIGGSDVGGILGVSKWSSPCDIYFSKINVPKEKEDDKEYMTIGSLMEDGVIIPFFELKHGLEVIKVKEMHKHKDYHFMQGNIDGMVIQNGVKKIIECKNVGGFKDKSKWGDEGSDEIPLTYLAQVAHYMEVFDINETILIALFGGNKIEEFYIKRDQGMLRDFSQKMIKIEIDFWENHVKKKNPPAAERLTDISLLFPYAEPESRKDASEEIYKRFLQYMKLDDKKKNLMKEIENEKLNILKFMGEEEILTFGGSQLLSYKNSKSKKTGEIGSRRFSISAKFKKSIDIENSQEN